MKQRWRIATILAAVCLGVAVAQPASAEPIGDFAFPLPAGQACEFDIAVAGTGGDVTVVENRGNNKKLVSSLLEGTGSNLTFTNPANTQSVDLASAPVSNKTFYYPNGRPELMINSGANVILLDDTDVGGPSTTLYQGTVVVAIDHKGDWEVLQHTGSTRGICAELS